MKRTTICKKLNAAFKAKKSCIRFEPYDITDSKYIKIVISDPFIMVESPFNRTDEFYDTLIAELHAMGAPEKIEFNNTGNLFYAFVDDDNCWYTA